MNWLRGVRNADGFRHLYCPICGQQPITQYENNRPVADFRCPACVEEYELKSKKGASGPKVPDGAFGAMMARLRSNAVPSLFLPNYDLRQFAVTDLIVMPRQFFVPEIIEQRKPHPGNRHVREKLRQQLQILRDKGHLEFMGRGTYRLTAA